MKGSEIMAEALKKAGLPEDIVGRRFCFSIEEPYTIVTGKIDFVSLMDNELVIRCVGVDEICLIKKLSEN